MTTPAKREKNFLKASLKRFLKFQPYHKADVHPPHKTMSFLRARTVPADICSSRHSA